MCQPCDVGIMKLLKTSFTSLCQDWKVVEHARLGGTGKIQAPSRAKVLQRLNIAWKDTSATLVQNFCPVKKWRG